MSVSSNYRNIKNHESLVYTSLIKSFKKASSYLNENIKELYTNHVYDICIEYERLSSNLNLYPKKSSISGIEGFWRKIGIYDMINQLRNPIEKAYYKGYIKRCRIFEPVIKETGVILNSDSVKKYSDLWVNLELSNYKGTITYTTKYNIIKILKNGIDNNLTVGEIQKQIVELNSKLFSKSRAKSIAITEVGKAYEYGNYQPVKQLYDAGISMKKYWLTCRDEKVREDHRECERKGWVDLEYIYPSVGTKYPPGGVNCRCTIEYDFDLNSLNENVE